MPTEVLSLRATEDELKIAEQLGSGNRSNGVRRALNLVAREVIADPISKVSRLLEQALAIAHQEELMAEPFDEGELHA